MNIAKKLISSLLATTMLISSFVALTAFAEAPTIKGTLLSDKFLFDEEDGIFNAATAGAGVEISFSNFEKNITYLDFELQIPKDLKIEYKVKKNTYGLEDITPTNIKNDALDSPVDFNVYDRSKSDSDFYTIYFQFVNSTATGLSPSEIINIYFASSMEDDAAAYVVKTGSFDIQNVNVGYLGDVDYIKNLSVVQATTASTPDPDSEPETPKYDEVTKIGDTYTDGTNDNAVGFVKTFAATETGAKYNMFAKFDGVEKKYKNTIGLPTVSDGRIGVGVVIQYGDSTVTVSDLRFEKVTE